MYQTNAWRLSRGVPRPSRNWFASDSAACTWPCFAAFRNQRCASAGLRATKSPSSSIRPYTYCACDMFASAARLSQRSPSSTFAVTPSPVISIIA
ncbi:hypothetical protein BGV48_14530 [Burkholderia ubonensis]|nr:hypothetical protein BGV48_14530 [Burkholderia ubonensis]